MVKLRRLGPLVCLRGGVVSRASPRFRSSLSALMSRKAVEELKTARFHPSRGDERAIRGVEGPLMDPDQAILHCRPDSEIALGKAGIRPPAVQHRRT